MGVKKVGNRLEELVKKMSSIQTENAYIGHFQEQGLHSQADMTYPELMKLHHNGGDMGAVYNVPPRPLLDYLFQANANLDDSRVTEAINIWLKSPFNKKDHKKLLNTIGKIIAEKERDMFGQSPPLAPNSDWKLTNEPLVDTGELRDNVAYMNTMDGKIKKIG